MSVSVLKTISNNLLSLVRQDSLLPQDIIATLDLLGPQFTPPQRKHKYPVLCPVGLECALPLGNNTTGAYGLSAFGLQQQLVVNAPNADAFLQHAAYSVFQQNKGVLFVDGAGDTRTWAQLYGYAQASGDTHRLRAINFMTGGQTPPFSSKLSHSVNILSGLSAPQLKSWIELMAQAACHTHPQFDLRHVKSNAAVFAAVFTHLSHSSNVFLTFSRMQQWSNVETFAQNFPKTPLGRVMAVDFSTWQNAFNAWNEYIAPLCGQWAHVLDHPKPDMHLMQSLRNKEIVLTLLPALESSTVDVQLLGNAVAATFVQHISETRRMDGVAFFNHAQNIVAPNIATKIAATTNSWGIVWSQTFDRTQTQTKPTLVMNADDAHLMGLTDTLKDGEGYFIEGNTPAIKITVFYTSAPKAQTLKLPLTQTLEGSGLPATPETHHKRTHILQQQMQQTSRNLAWCHETVARMYGYGSWHEAVNAYK